MTSERAIKLATRLSRRLAAMQLAAAICASWAEVCPGALLEAFRARLKCKRYERAVARAERLQ